MRVMLGRLEEATAAALSALSVGERETDPRDVFVTFPMRTLGLCYLATKRFDEAIVMLERALAIRETKHLAPLRLAEMRSPLARALFEGGSDPRRALALAHQALGEYEQVASTPVVARDRAELESWLATVGSPKSGQSSSTDRP
jgi:hypothetical protein